MTSFKDWLDERNMSPEVAASIFGKSVGTIRNWRSAGVPELLREWVEQRMAELDAPARTLDRVVLEITDDQFSAWNAAALEEGLLLKEWAIQTLDEAALDPTGSSEAFNPLESLKVAEPGTDYDATKKSGGA